jgi:hypothetical protein
MIPSKAPPAKSYLRIVGESARLFDCLQAYFCFLTQSTRTHLNGMHGLLRISFYNKKKHNKICNVLCGLFYVT